jgi:hypothetical protein
MPRLDDSGIPVNSIHQGNNRRDSLKRWIFFLDTHLFYIGVLAFVPPKIAR